MFRMAIIGIGMISTKAMIPAVRGAKTATLYALGSSSPDKAARLRDAAEQVYPSYQQVLDDPAVDGVYIGLPNHLHKEWTLKALSHGKDVLCDKPLAMNLGETKEMNAAAQSAGRVLMEGFMYRFHPQHTKVKALIASGAIGRVRLFEAHFHYFLEDLGNIRMQPETGGGGLYDIGCYGIDSARYVLAGEPTSCSGRWSVRSDSGTDEFCHFTLNFSDDRVAAITCGTHLQREQTYAVYGDLGAIRLPMAYVPKASKSNRVLVSTEEGEKQHTVSPTDQYAVEVDAFVAACRGDRDSRIESGLENMSILDTVRRACQTGRVETI